MSISLYINCTLMAIGGMGLSTITILQSLKNKAKLANVAFTPKSYFKDDGLLNILGTSMMTLMGLVTLEYITMTVSPLILLALFATGGYTGTDLASRFFSVANRRINDVIDLKTTQADKITGTLDTPTPTKQ